VSEARLAVVSEIAKLSTTDVGNTSTSAQQSGAAGSSPGSQSNEQADRETTQHKLSLLRSLDAIYFHHESLLETKERLEAETKSIAKEQAKLEEFGLEEPKPYSFLLLETVKDQLADEGARADAIKADAKSSKLSFEAAHAELDRAEAQRRAAAKPSSDSTPTDTGEGLQAASPTELAVTLARAKTALAETDLGLQRSRLEACQARQKLLQRKIDTLASDTKFSSQDRDAELERLTALEADLDRQRVLAEPRFHDIEEAKTDAAPPAGNPQNKAIDSDSRRAAREVYNARLLLLEQQREQLAVMRRLWKHR
jgi:hypothetical protein